MNRFCLLVLAWSPACALAQHRPQVSETEVTGTFRSKGGNFFAIQALGSNRLKVQFDGQFLYYPLGKPMVNVGHALGIATIQADSALFKPYADDDCLLVLTFLPGNRLAVEQRGEGTCGFGHNVTASDLYRKVSRRKPKFDTD